MTVVDMQKTNTERKRGATRFAASPTNLLKLIEVTKDRFTKEQVADELGVSESHLKSCINGTSPTSRVLDRAAEGLVRRFAKVEGDRIVIAHIATQHWPTIRTLIRDLRGDVIEEIDTLHTSTPGGSPESTLVIFTLDQRHLIVVEQLIKSTGGAVKKKLP